MKSHEEWKRKILFYISSLFYSSYLIESYKMQAPRQASRDWKPSGIVKSNFNKILAFFIEEEPQVPDNNWSLGPQEDLTIKYISVIKSLKASLRCFAFIATKTF